MPKAPCLFAPADDRNGLATTPAGCFGRVHTHLAADLGRDAGALDRLAEASDVQRCTPETKVKVDLASRFSTRSARKFIHEQSESYTVSPSAAN